MSRKSAKSVWQVAEPVTLDGGLLALVDQQPVVASLLARRGHTDQQRARAFIDPQFYTPALPAALPDLAKAAALLIDAVDQHKTILIWGDFDVDGQTSSALLLEALRPLTDVRLHIPNRARDSHGIGREALAQRIMADKPAVLLTCDTGISAHDSIDYANSCGIATIITDHHDLAPMLPDADAVINPKRLPPEHPLYTLPGVGVAFKLVEALYMRLDRKDEIAQFLDLVALGIVADVAAQIHDTRYLLQIGLERLRYTQRPGLRALFEVARLNPLIVSADEIGYQLGPRLNAAGRLGDPMIAVELLTTHDPQRVPILAQQLEGFNEQRRLLQRTTEEAARQLIEADTASQAMNALVVYAPDWHIGVLGPVAGRLSDDYGRPIVMLTSDSDGRIARGSARSAAGYDLFAALSAVADLLLSYGGHPGAAGVSLTVANIPMFRRALSAALAQQTPSTNDADTLAIDALLPLDQVAAPLAAALAKLAPFGEGNPPAVFESDDVQVVSAPYLDRQHVHRQLTIEDANGVRRAVYWWNSSESVPDARIDVAYTLKLTPSAEPEMTLIGYRVHDLLATVPRVGRPLHDLRDVPDPRAALEHLKSEVPDLAIWAEGFTKAESPGLPRHELQTHNNPLAIYTAPPSPAVLSALITQLAPSTIYVFGVEPPMQTSVEFMRQLEGVARFVIRQHAGHIDLSTLCGRLAQSEAAIRSAVDGLPGIMCEWPSPDKLHFLLINGKAASISPRLTALLDESRAYRNYFRRAPLTSLGL